MQADRLAWQEREADTLATYAMRSGATRGRPLPEEEDPWRTPFQRDRDRIIHSASFRKLAYKTQVFVNYSDDFYYRTRLTHTVEATQITRTIARALRLNEDLAEAVSLVHDLGHPPFAHYGEEALHAAMEPYEGFDHNSQTLRIVDELEPYDPRFRGLNLSWEVREGSAKHKTVWRVRPVDEFSGKGAHPSLEAQVADLSDEIAYTCHDLDDGIRSGHLTFEMLERAGLPLWGETAALIEREMPDLDAVMRRKQIVRRLINRLVTDLIQATAQHLESARPDGVDAIRTAEEETARFSETVRDAVKTIKAFLLKELYRHYQVMRMGEAGKQVVRELFAAYLQQPEKLPPAARGRLDQDGLTLTICDHVAGLTDRAALAEHEALFRLRTAWLP